MTTGNHIADYENDNHPNSPSSNRKEEYEEELTQQDHWDHFNNRMFILEARIKQMSKNVDDLVLETNILVEKNRIIMSALKNIKP